MKENIQLDLDATVPELAAFLQSQDADMMKIIIGLEMVRCIHSEHFSQAFTLLCAWTLANTFTPTERMAEDFIALIDHSKHAPQQLDG